MPPGGAKAVLPVMLALAHERACPYYALFFGIWAALAATARQAFRRAPATRVTPACSLRPRPFCQKRIVAALANELSGETAKRNLEGLARFHRQRGSQGFHAAAELVAERARAYGLSNVQILQFRGTERSFRHADVPSGLGCRGRRADGSHRDGKESEDRQLRGRAVVLAEDSESADVTADLVDVGGGSQDSDYAGKDIKGRIVLTSSPPGEVQDIAVGKFNAAGIVSYAQNQKTAWSGDNDNLVRWGHLTTFSPNRTFAFMVSLKTARALQERLKGGEKISLHAQVTAGQHPGPMKSSRPPSRGRIQP